MRLRLLVALLGAAMAAVAAPDHSAARLAAQAKHAQNAGQVVRAYLLFTEAAARDPNNASYAMQRDALKPLAKLLTESNVQSSAGIAEAVRAAEEDAGNESLPDADAGQTSYKPADLLPPPHLEPQSGVHNFDIRADARTLLTQVARAFGIEATFDPDFDSGETRRFAVDQTDFASAMSGATAVTGTFAFAVAPHRIFVARDTEAKRSEFEPEIEITVDVPNAIEPREVVESANAVRGAAGVRGTIAWSSTKHEIVIRDHVAQARAAAAILEELVLPKAQVSFEVELMTVDSDDVYKYGVNWQTTYQILPLGVLSQLHNPGLPSIVNSTTFLPIGGGASLMGIGLASASLFATYTGSSSNVLYDATLLAGTGQMASLHIGDRYPVATALSSGGGQSNSAAAYNPLGQVQQEDLGLSVKLTPHVTTDGTIRLDLEAEYKTLGNQPLDSVPSINQRAFKGTLTLQEGQWAVVAGMDEESRSVSRQGFPGLGGVPGLDLLFAQTTREHRKSNTMLVIKPSITRMPMSGDFIAAYMMGPRRGSRTIF